MASKTINGSTANENISSRMVCSSTANVAGNYSLVTVSGRLSRTNTGYTTSGTGTFYLVINGTKYENSGYYEITYNSDTAVITASNVKVPHNADGTKTISVSFTGSIPDTTLTSISCSGTFTLDDIPRESAVSANVSTIAAGGSITVSLDRAVSSYTHDITFTIGSASQTVTGVGASTTFTVPKAWQNQFPNATSATLTITAVTKSGTTTIGTTTTTVKVTTSADAVPTISASVANVNPYWGLYIRTYSRAQITLSCAAQYGATIKSYQISGGGYSGTTNPYTTGYLQTAGTNTFTCKVTDSRGLTSTTTVSISVTDYSPPAISSAVVHRTNAAGTDETNGNYIYVKATRTYSTCGGNNSCVLSCAYKEASGSYGSSTTLTSGTAVVLGGGAIVSNKFYTVKITVADYFTSVSREYTVYTDQYRAVFGKDAAGILRYPPDGGSGLYTTDATLSGTLSAVNVKASAAVSAPVVQATSSMSAPTLQATTNLGITGGEANDIVTLHQGNGVGYNSDFEELASLSAITHPLRFKWYDSYWDIGNVRSSSTPTSGFGFAVHDTDQTYKIVGYIGKDGKFHANDIKAETGSVFADQHLYIGYDYNISDERAVRTIWADGATHNIVSRTGSGLMAAFGWSGSSDYATVCRIRGQTCQYQNSSGTTVLSDERMKKDFADLEKWEAFYGALEPLAFKLINGNSGRYHIGFKAQQVEAALEDSGLSTQDFAGLVKCAYEPDEEDPIGMEAYSKAGIKAGEDEYGLIYTEFIALNTYMIQKLKAENEALKQEIEALKKTVSEIASKLT